MPVPINDECPGPWLLEKPEGNKYSKNYVEDYIYVFTSDSYFNEKREGRDPVHTIKIGRGNDPEERLKQHQCSNPNGVYIYTRKVWAYAGNIKNGNSINKCLEKTIHTFFEHYGHWRIPDGLDNNSGPQEWFSVKNISYAIGIIERIFELESKKVIFFNGRNNQVDIDVLLTLVSYESGNDYWDGKTSVKELSFRCDYFSNNVPRLVSYKSRHSPIRMSTIVEEDDCKVYVSPEKQQNSIIWFIKSIGTTIVAFFSFLKWFARSAYLLYNLINDKDKREDIIRAAKVIYNIIWWLGAIFSAFVWILLINQHFKIEERIIRWRLGL
jgi:hypothetical protein